MFHWHVLIVKRDGRSVEIHMGQELEPLLTQFNYETYQAGQKGFFMGWTMLLTFTTSELTDAKDPKEPLLIRPTIRFTATEEGVRYEGMS